MKMTTEEIFTLYQDIQKKLTEPFPKGTLEGKGGSDAKYIPVQAYVTRLEEVAGPYWSWRTVGEPIVYEEQEAIEVRGVLKILSAEREGIGFASYQRYQDTGKIKNFKYVVLAASSEALRDACDKYRMGWSDLAPYRKWSKNPGVGLQVLSEQQDEEGTKQYTNRNCLVCQQALTTDDIELLQQCKVKIDYCEEHIPKHFLKKKTN